MVELSAYTANPAKPNPDELPTLVDDNEADDEAEMAEWFALDELEVANAEDSVLGTVVAEPECVSVPWLGTAEAPFEQMDLTDAVYYGESGPEVGMVAGDFNDWTWKSNKPVQPRPAGIQKPAFVETTKARKKKLISIYGRRNVVI